MFDFVKRYMGHSGRFRPSEDGVSVLHVRPTDAGGTVRIVHLGIRRQEESLV